MKNPADIYVGNLAMETTEEDLLRLFASCGEVLQVRVNKDNLGDFCKACVTMQNEEEAAKAIELLTNQQIHNKTLVLILDTHKLLFQKYSR
jgi:RNA recognition motif-containing protein